MGVAAGRGMGEEGWGDIFSDGDKEIVHAVWTLVRTSGLETLNEIMELVSDFISKVYHDVYLYLILPCFKQQGLTSVLDFRSVLVTHIVLS